MNLFQMLTFALFSLARLSTRLRAPGPRVRHDRYCGEGPGVGYNDGGRASRSKGPTQTLFSSSECGDWFRRRQCPVVAVVDEGRHAVDCERTNVNQLSHEIADTDRVCLA
ncbi:uncharacterized protein C8Q71DRAFT_784117 [Rhodofomes roseus]|uniref:Secreted protein n=1 Tax=Rhodofomes roseus TaxID=34475 RepID=A0ABQ8K3B7_9APHY|nr:uncharacterized protein C8Q71DRAFT_784117 [Rhodofomes roseus]KAH9831028.1 hypothetical protein C8Q71DRAFT_784117 [Rhodofomes roseus]